MKDRTQKQSGFTLLEMLLVIAIIAILAGIVIVAINPAKQLGDANNAQRQSDILAILNAVHQYSIDNSGDLSTLDLHTISDAEDQCGEASEDEGYICKNGESCAGNTDLDILADDPNYITDIPVDPLVADSDVFDGDTETGYVIVQDSDNDRITVCAPLAENDEVISVTR